MISKLLNILKSNRAIVSNLSYLSILQILSLLLPFISYPYLIKVLGAKSYGLIIYSQAITSYLSIVINFGFNITATRDISIFRNNQRRLDIIVSSVLQIKGILFLVALTLLYMYIFVFDITGIEKKLYLLSMWVCLYEFLFPLWFFQGIEKMKYVTILSVLSKLIFTVLIFIFITSQADILLFPILNGVGVIVSIIFSFYLLKKNNVRLKFVKQINLKYYIKKSYVMALANASNTFKSNFNVIIIKNVLSYSAVAYFDLALKILNIGITFLDLISQSIFPKMSISKDINFLKKVIAISTAISLSMTLAVYFLGSYVIQILGGSSMQNAVPILKVLSLNFPLYIIGALLGRNCLIVFGFQGEVLKSMLFSSLFYISVIALLKIFSGEIDVLQISSAFVLSYLFELIFRYASCKKHKLF